MRTMVAQRHSRHCLWLYSGRVRYHYTHEILPGVQLFGAEQVPVPRTRRISIMLRDEFQSEFLETYMQQNQ